MVRGQVGVDSKKRAGRSVRSVVRAERRDYMRRNPLQFCALSIPGPVIMLLLIAFTPSSFVRGFLAGLALALFGFGLWYPFVLNGSHVRGIGADAEGYTSEELRKLDERRWRVIDDIAFDGFNVDHVLIGPGRVYAVETKWRSTRVGRRQLNDLASQARKAADKARLLLRSQKAPISVDPMVVIWGPGRAALPPVGESIGGVWFVPGPEAKHWRPLIEQTASGMELNYPVVDAVRRYVVRRDEHLAVNGR